MKRFEKRISGLLIGSIFPLSLGLLSLTIWFLLDKSESRLFIYLISGLLIGGLIDIKFLKSWINQRFNLPIWIIASIYIMYNIFVYGFFMGLPVFNAFLGLLAGYYFGNRICFNKIKPERQPKLLNQVSLFTGVIMTLVCISSGFLAIYDNGAAGMIQDVLGLNFEVTRSMLWGIVLIGGFILIFVNVFLTRYTMIKTIKNYA
ncbi:MAG TPA: hypothetical protein PLW22_07730, partial [Tenuifilum sp.]|nr:hypothetical protein [Tenuifilum sp.]